MNKIDLHKKKYMIPLKKAIAFFKQTIRKNVSITE